MRNMTVSKKLIAGFLIVTAFSVLLAGLGIFSGLSTNANYTYLIEKPIEREMLLAEIQFQFTMMRYRAANFAMETGNPDIITGTLTPQYQSAYDAFTEALDAYLENNNADPRRAADIKTANADNASTLRTLADQFKRESDRVREIALSGDAAGATTALRDVIPITNEINALLGNMITPAAELVASESQNMDESAVIFTIVLAGTAFVCFVISMVLAVYIARLIAKPLKDMMGYIKQAGETGNLHFRDDEWANCDRLSAGRDEIGQTMKAFTAMMRKFVHYGEAVGQVAAQDLTLEVATLGDSDTFG
ncbi:MAG: hypothetical protein LBR85_04975, partial [Oscillospiraceae bacterium]|nr:hypothetical protein [Oscillospiraceae bacterium]